MIDFHCMDKNVFNKRKKVIQVQNNMSKLFWGELSL